MNELWSGFDAICERTGVEKIKTIGDAYLAIGGLDGGTDHAAAIAETALQMIEQVEAEARARGRTWRIRIGLHSGPAVAGVIGTTKFAYDVWGDTVNVAARLEGASEPNRIHVSGTLAAQLEDRYLLTPRGSVELKGKGSSRPASCSVDATRRYRPKVSEREVASRAAGPLRGP